jgi:transcriptional regulator with XRE-family HTH domain
MRAWYRLPMPWDEEGRRIREPQVQRGMEMVGAAMRRQRIRRRLTQRALQAMTGVHQSTISKFERGRRCGLRWSRFATIVAVLGGLDFGPGDPARWLGPMGLSPNPGVATPQLDDLQRTLDILRARVADREAEIAADRADNS